MYFVYVLESIPHPGRFYVGSAADVEYRLRRHNAGHAESQSRHTSMYGPWKIVIQIGFPEKSKAIAFEKYLKSGSGRAFAKKHF
jgi:predicted GIY-YIG superfamily endonuclease